MTSMSSMTRAEKKKLGVAIGAFALAMAILAWYVLVAGPGAPSREEQAAQQAVLERMGSATNEQPAPGAGETPGSGSTPPPPPSTPAPPAAPPAGRPRAVKPGT
jgi:type IV secretory pathway VirB10-like protein